MRNSIMYQLYVIYFLCYQIALVMKRTYVDDCLMFSKQFTKVAETQR